MKNKSRWSLYKSNLPKLETILDRKITHVSEKIFRSETGTRFQWTGELDGDDYFMVTMADGVLVGRVSDREMLIKYDALVLATHEIIEEVEKEPDYVAKLRILFERKEELVAETNKFTFKDVMKLLTWKFSSKKVEIYRDTSLATGR